MSPRSYLAFRLLLPFMLHAALFAQKGSSGAPAAQANPQAAQTPGGQSGGQGLQGFSFAPDEWPQLTLPDVTNSIRGIPGRTVLCYKLAKANSATQPFILQRIKLPNEVVGTGFDRPCGDNGSAETDTEGRKWCLTNPQTDGHWNVCSPLDEQHPIYMGEELVIGVDISGLSDSGANINQLKLLNINVTTQGSSPLNPTPIRPSFPGTAAAGATASTGYAGEASQSAASGGWWTELPTRPAAWDGHSTWEAGTNYKKGDVVADHTLTRFYRANRQCFNSGPALQDPFPRQARTDRITDGSVVWQEMNEPPLQVSVHVADWQPKHAYDTNAVIKVWRGPGQEPGKAVAQRAGQNQRLQAFDRIAIDPVSVANLAAQLSEINVSKETLSSAAAGSAMALNEVQVSFQSAAAIKQMLEVPKWTKGCKNLDKADESKGKHKKTPKAQWQYYWAVKGGISGSVPADPFSIALIPRAIYIPWPYQLPGDVIPTFTVSLVYTPPVPGAPWQGDTFYPAGSIVTSTANSGHYYTALTGGFSDREPREPNFPVDAPPTVEDGSLVWLDSGMSAPSVSAASGQPAGQGGGSSVGAGGTPSGGGSGKPQQWLAKSHYLVGDVILDPYNGHYYTMVRSIGGSSGPGTPQPTSSPSPQPTNGKSKSNSTTTSASAEPSAKDPFPQLLSSTTIRDGELLLVHTATAAQLQAWQPEQPYKVGSYININGFSYKVIRTTASTAKTGAEAFPAGAVDRVLDGDVIWQAEGSALQSTAPRQASQTYSFGDAVSVESGNGNIKLYKLYVMVGSNSGLSGATEPITPNAAGRPTTVADGDLLWMATTVHPPTCLGLPKWRPTYPYHIDDVVYGSDCQQYKMIRYTAGTSGSSPQSPFPANTGIMASNEHPYPRTILDGTVVWKVYKGMPETASEWVENTTYEEGAIVYAKDDPNYPTNPDKIQYWSALNPGKAGSLPAQPAFPIFEPRTVIEPKSELALKQGDAAVWEDSGVIRPIGLPPGNPTWVAEREYNPGDVAFVPGPGNGRYYTALSTNKNQDPRSFAMSYQNFPQGYPQLPVTWQDSGTVPPAAVSGSQPSDQTISLASAPLPQTHSLSYFNLAAGVVVPFVRPATFGWTWSQNVSLPSGYAPATNAPASMGLAPSSIGGGCTIGTTKMNGVTPVYYCPTKVHNGSYPVDPVLAFTAYIFPVDAETPFRWTAKNLMPGFSAAFSLANPTNNFYLGGSSEFLVRNVQVFYGLAFIKTPTALTPASTQPIWGGSGAAPAVMTQSGFQKGFFLGFTFNLSGFIQSLGFGGSKSSTQ